MPNTIYNVNAYENAKVLKMNSDDMEKLLACIGRGKNGMNQKMEEMMREFSSLDDAMDSTAFAGMNAVFDKHRQVMQQCIDSVNGVYDLVNQLMQRSKTLYNQWINIATTEPGGSGMSQDAINSRIDNLNKQQAEYNRFNNQ